MVLLGGPADYFLEHPTQTEIGHVVLGRREGLLVAHPRVPRVLYNAATDSPNLVPSCVP